jgi:ankyrin repeat protein
MKLHAFCLILSLLYLENAETMKSNHELATSSQIFGSRIEKVSEKEETRERYTKLITYIEHDNVEKIKEMISSETDSNLNEKILNIRDKYGHTPLWMAAKKCNLDMMHQLLKCSADANTKNRFKEPLLIHLLKKCSLRDSTKFEMVKLLLEYGADPKIKTKDFDSSLIAAIKGFKDEKIRFEVVKLLLEKDRSIIDQTGFGGKTPYQYANVHRSKNPTYSVMKLMARYGGIDHDKNLEELRGFDKVNYLLNNLFLSEDK